MIEVWAMPFMQRALVAGILIGFLSGYYGVFIVQRKMSFLGSGLAHAAFGGVALGMLLNQQPLAIAVPFTIMISLAITYIKDKTKLGIDTSIGILTSFAMALGIIFLALKTDYATDAFNYLFGSLLSVFPSDLMVASVIAALTIATFVKIWKRWAYATFDTELAAADRVPVKLDDYLLSVLTAVTIVASVKIVGIVLIAAYLVIPAASARLLSKTFFKMTVVAIIISIISSLAGLWLSFILDLPTGAVIIILQTIIFVFSFTVVKIGGNN